jgi:hypothetical protein
MDTVDDFVVEWVNNWPILAAYKGAVTNPNPFAMYYILNMLQSQMEDSSVSTMSSARFMGVVNAVWCSYEQAPFVNIETIRPLIAYFAWELIFSTLPDPGHLEFTDEFYRANFATYTRGSALQTWDDNWDSVANSNRRMAAANLIMAHLPLQICEWHFVSTHLSCLAFISI